MNNTLAERHPELYAKLEARKAGRPEPRTRDISEVLQSINAGPGTELKKLLRSVGIKAGSRCGCNRLALLMNVWGPDECERRIPEIVAAMTEEANRRKWIALLPFKEIGAELLVKQAIAAARKKISEKEV